MTYFTWRSCRAISRIIAYMASIGCGFLKKRKNGNKQDASVCFRVLTFWLWFYFFTIWWVILNLSGVSLQLLYKQILFPQKHLTFWHKKLPEFINCRLQEWWRIYQLQVYMKKAWLRIQTPTYEILILSNSIEYFIFD